MNLRITLLLRHVEAEKNIRNSFSRDDGVESLTERGSQASSHVAALVGAAASSTAAFGGPLRTSVHTAPAMRAHGTALGIAKALGVQVQVHDGLRPIRAGRLAGVSENEAAQLAPEFIRNLGLYRAGIFNSYDLSGYGEDVRAFEARVGQAMNEIDDVGGAGVRVVVGHRSCVTAWLISVARRSLGYPKDFYGYAPLDLGAASGYVEWVDGAVSWAGVNLPPQELLSNLQELLTGR